MPAPGATRLRASALGAFLVLTGAVAAAAAQALPDLGPGVSVSALRAGGVAIVRPAAGAPVAAVELWFRAPSTGFGPKPAPGLARLAAQAVAGSKPLVGATLGSLVTDAGGRLAIAVYGDSVSVSAVVPAGAAPRVVRGMTTAFFAPVLTEDGFRQAQRDVRQESLLATFDPETVVRNAVFGQLFSDGPQHYPVLAAPKDAGGVAIGDVRAFAVRAFRSANATLVVSGAVDASIAGAAVAGRPVTADAGPEAPVAPSLAVAPGSVTQPFSQASGGYGWVGPPIADPREATAMDFIADYLFRADDGLVTRRAAERYPESFVVGQFITLHDPGVMFVAFSGKNATALRGLVDDGFAAIRTPLDPKAFAAARASFEYHLLSDLQTPTQLADNFGWYSVEGDPAYAPGASGTSGAYFKAADALTPAFVASIAQKYLGREPVVVTLQPDAAEKSP